MTPSTDAIVAFLRDSGADELRHAHGHSLLDHLVGTYEIVQRWNQPVWLQHAALLHSVYGTEAYRQRLLAPGRRREVAAVAGDRAERLAYLFGVVQRGPLLAGTYRWAKGWADGDATRDELDALVLIHMANLAEQAQAGDASPGRWLVRLAELAELLVDSEAVTPPLFAAALAASSDADEALARRCYLAGVARVDEPAVALDRLALAASACPVVPEPCVWLAYLARARGDDATARSWAAEAAKRLSLLGTAWDKRLSFVEWAGLTEALKPLGEGLHAGDGTATIGHPRWLYDSVVGVSGGVRGAGGGGGAGGAGGGAGGAGGAGGRERFHRYVEMLADGNGSGALYPGLPSRPWYDAVDFPLARHLESQFAAIRDEILGLDPKRFQPESERIERAGDWDVAFFYERGRRHDEVCAACPVTTRAVETFPALRGPAGLIYASRMRAATQVGAHRGPTNLRLRCHLAVKVPEGDCAIRVGDEVRRWREGKCLVFDDHFEHEAWNHTDDDRLVLIVDLWHPDLGPTEIRLLEGLQSYTYAYARRLGRYWSVNAAAGRAGSED